MEAKGNKAIIGSCWSLIQVLWKLDLIPTPEQINGDETYYQHRNFVNMWLRQYVDG
jgi:hypothetical protein